MSLGDSIGSSLGRAIGAALSGGSDYASIVTNGVLAPYVTFTRASSATYFDSAGVMQTALTDVPRINYDPATLALRGLLIEESRTNLLTYSEQFDNAAWEQMTSTITPNSTAAPDGTLTADRLVATGVGYHYVRYVYTEEGALSYSVHVKRVNHDWLFFSTPNDASLNYYNVATDTFGTLQPGVTATSVALPNGWYRLTFSFTAVASKQVSVGLAASDGSGAFISAGTEAVDIWGAQLETGAFATSYIPTTSAAVTRAADNGVLNTLSTIGYNALEGTLYVEGYTAPGIGASSVNLVSLNDGAANELIALRHVTGGATHDYTVVDGGVAQVDTAGTAVTALSAIKAAIAWKANDFAQSVNGGAAQTDASGTLPTVDRLTLGAFNGNIKTLRYYPRRLSDAELVALTA